MLIFIADLCKGAVQTGERRLANVPRVRDGFMNQTIKKMSLAGLILMIFTSVFGFANSPSAFYLMGYSAIPWYIFSALLFFIPFALMMAEMGSAYRKEEGGI